MLSSTHNPNPTSALWEDILKVAILGTERQSLDAVKNSVSAAQDSASRLINQLDATARESSVLSAAAILASYHRTGQIPSVSKGIMPQPCPPETMPCCNSAASTRLTTLLQPSRAPLFAEWLQVAAECGLRIPEEHLPKVLETGKWQSEMRFLRPTIIAVLGERGRWLAAQNPTWSFAVAVTDEQLQNSEIWQTGSKAERLSFLKLCRQREAAKARELLASTWAQEPPAERAEFLAVFANGLSMADEEFLENALDDKRKEVRQTAVELLAQLPESRLVARHFERLKPVLRFSEKSKLMKLVGRGATIEVELPKEFDRAMARDGIQEISYGGGQQGVKAGWVHQMVGVVPPQLWESEWGLIPREIIQIISIGEWKHALLGGFAHAAIRHQSIEWLEAFFEQATRDQYLTNSFGALPHLENAFSLLSQETLERLLLLGLKDIVNTKNGDISDRWWVLLQKHRSPWSKEFSRTLLKWAREEIRNSKELHEWSRYSFREWAFWIPTELFDEATAGWPNDVAHWEKWEPVVNDFLHILEMRREMRRELYESRPQ